MRAARRRAAAGGALAALLLTGCAAQPGIDPLTWWHHLEGGRIARSRPPPPAADAPFPSLGTVPSAPQTLDAATRGRIAQGLLADRANARYAEATTPIPPLPQVGPAPAADSGATMGAQLAAASTPPATSSPAAPHTPPR
ncbi:MAG: hypothetical protein KGL55_13585, partial [Rhodospirillales bacterium]|nr:hypothetical protein [Rhodospirillales bacterium]